MDGDGKRGAKRRSLEAGREMLARYKASHGNAETSQADSSDVDELLVHHRDTEDPSVDHQNSSMLDDTSCIDTTQSSMSVSEGEGDGDIEGMAGHIAELKELVQGKEAIIESLSAEIDHMRAEASSPNSSQSHNSSTPYRDILHVYQTKLQDFETAITQRDQLIQELSSSLEQTLQARNALKIQLQTLNALPALTPASPGTEYPLDAQNQITQLQMSLNYHLDLVKRLEIDKQERDSEISHYKAHINQLNENIQSKEAQINSNIEDTLKTQKEYETQVEKITRDMQVIFEKFKDETESKAAKHQLELENLEAKHLNEISQMKQQHEEQCKTIFERYSRELPEMETKHAKELSVFQSQLSSYKKTIDILKSELDNQSEKSEVSSLKTLLLNSQQEKEMLHEQIKLHKIQVEEMTAKYIATASVFDSKESIERSLEEALTNVASLKQENETLKFKYDDLSARYSAAQALTENNQLHDRSLSNKVYDLEKSLGRLSGINNASFMSEFNATTYQTFDDMAIQFQMAKSKLDEKESLEKRLFDRIQILEESVLQANKQLEEANMEKRSYEKQLKDMKNNCDKMMSDLQNSSNVDKKYNESSSNQKSVNNEVSDKLEILSKEIEELRQIIKKKDSEISEKDHRLQDTLDKMKAYQSKCDQLKSGLTMAWKQCAEQEEKLSQSLATNQSRLNESFTMSTLGCTLNNNELVDVSGVSDVSCNDSKLDPDDTNVPFNLDETERRNRYEKIESENQRLLDENSGLSKTLQNLEFLKKSLDDVNKEKSQLVTEIENLNEKHKEEIVKLKLDFETELGRMQSLLSGSGIERFKEDLEKKHAKEMEKLRTYFEQKCVEMERQYSDEIFSVQSKKMSDDSSETDEMTDDLYYGGGGDCTDATKSRKSDHDTLGNRANLIDQHCQTELDDAVVNGELTELTELRAAYSLQLEEQVELARQDIVNALQEQVQALLAVESDTDENWPPELLQLRNKFTSNAKRELEKLKEAHASEIFQINEEHSRMLTRTIERFEEKMQQFTGTSQKTYDEEHNVDAEVLQQKYDNLYKTCVTLKGLVVDLVKYLVTCEEELNNTFVGEIIKRQALSETQTTSDLEQETEENPEKKGISNLSPIPPSMKIKRVHFAPQTNRISSIVNSGTDILLELIEEEKDIAAKLRDELDKCLERMKTESAQIVNISLQPGETMLDTLSKQVLWTTKVNEELSAKLLESESLIEDYQGESRQLKMKIMNLQQKLITIDEKKEIISEGYGEHDDTGNEILEEDLSQLQEKARSAVLSGTGDNNYLLQLIEELCRCNEKLIEDFRKEKEDLQQQIDAADKQLRSTRKFLEEQASEREMERDDAARQIISLQEQLRERERDKERDLRITSEPSSPSLESSSTSTLVPQATDTQAAVEALEIQMREMSSLVSDTEAKKSETEGELKIAVEKIWVLRDIIVDLEQQIQAKNQNEETLVSQLQQLREVIKTQSQNQRELAEELEAIKSGGDSQMNDHLTHLQDELRKHKLSTEHFNVNSTALKQMKSELREMQNHLDKRIKELEALHMCGSNLSISQPSEDVSIRDQIDASRCQTPDDDPTAPPTLPLDQLLKFKEKLLKHSRTEEVAFKKIKDLDMQLSALKIQNEELLAEQEILQQNNSEQLFQIEQMRGRLEQYKHSAPFAQRQATSKLELELHELNAKLQSMEQTVANKDLEVKNLQVHLERVNQLLIERQHEFASAVQNENDLIQELRNRLEIVEHEKRGMEARLNAQHDLPQLIHSMLEDKNEEIDHLKEQLFKKEKQLEALIEDNNVKQQTPKNSARTLSDIVSINSECEEVCEAMRETPNVNRNFSHNMSSIRVHNTLQMTQGKEPFDGSAATLVDPLKCELRIPPLELGNSQSPNHRKRDSMHSEFNLTSPPSINTMPSDVTDHIQSPENERSDSRGKISSPNVDKNQSTNSGSTKLAVEDLENRLKTIYEELKAKSTILSEREIELIALKKSLEELQTESKYTIENLTQDKIFFQNQYELSQETENKIREDLEEVENHLKITTEELESYKGKIQMNEQILMEIQTENKNLKQEISKIREINSSYESTVREKATELNNLRELIFEKDITIETVQTRNVEIENENKQLYEFKTKFEICRQNVVDCQNEIKRLNDGINSRDGVIRRLEDMTRRSSSGELNSSSSDDSKDQEIHHLKEYLKEKEKIIRQMSEDSKSLHRSLETIQNKMKESGNVIELRKKLHQERKCNGEMVKMIGKLTNELDVLKEESTRQTTEVNDIEDMVQRELNLSADLDRKIMDAIESESEEISMRNMHSSNSVNMKPVEQDLEKIMEQYLEIRNELKRQTKTNKELVRQKDELEIQREMLKAQVSEYENRILQIKTDLEKECKKNVCLDEEISSRKTAIRNLEIQLRREKSSFQKAQLQDSELINMLRIKCTSSLNAEEEMRNSLTSMRQKYKAVTTQLMSLKSQIESNRIGQVPASPNLPEAEQSEILLAEKYEKEHRLNLELQETIKKLEIQKKRCEKELDIAMEENEKLMSRIALTEDVKNHLEIDLKRTKEDLKSRDEECEWLQKRIKTMTDADKKRQQQSLDKQSEFTDLRKELENMRDVMNDLQEDVDESRRQLNLSLSEQGQLTQVVMSLRKTESELKKKLNEATNEEERLKEIISNLESRIRSSVRRDFDSPKDTSGNERVLSASQYRQNIMDLNSEIDRYSHEKNILFEKLKKARDENVKFGDQIRELEEVIRTRRYENSEAISKLQHVYGKYIRADSKRKALAFQKRYLLCVIGGYQLSEETTLSVLAQLTNAQKSFMLSDNDRRTPKIRFRCCVLAVISIHRMKWKVQRWRTGIRKNGTEIVRGRPEQSFLPIQRHENEHSPPVRGGKDNGLNFEHFLQRVLNIQQTLGLATGETTSRDQL